MRSARPSGGRARWSAAQKRGAAEGKQEHSVEGRLQPPQQGQGDGLPGPEYGREDDGQDAIPQRPGAVSQCGPGAQHGVAEVEGLPGTTAAQAGAIRSSCTASPSGPQQINPGQEPEEKAEADLDAEGDLAHGRPERLDEGGQKGEASSTRQQAAAIFAVALSAALRLSPRRNEAAPILRPAAPARTAPVSSKAL